MKLEDYLDFDTEHDRIKVKGTRIGIDVLIDDFNEGMSPEVIVSEYHPSLTLEQVYGTLTYYLHNKEDVDAYIKRVVERAERNYQEHLSRGLSPTARRARERRQEQVPRTGASLE